MKHTSKDAAVTTSNREDTAAGASQSAPYSGKTAEHDAVEASAAAATAQTEMVIDGAQAGQEVASEGIRAQRVLTMKQFYPTMDWIMQNVVAKGSGTHVKVGRLYGKARATERTTNDWQGKQLVSVKIEGVFEGIALESGEITRCTAVYLPLAFAEQIEMALATNTGAIIDIDVDIGIEATGKTIPYQWTVTSYIDGAAERALRGMRNRRPTALAGAALARLGQEQQQAANQHQLTQQSAVNA